MPHSTQMSTEIRECIDSCLNCHAACIETATHCLELGGEHASKEHQTLLADCAQACSTSADFMLRMSPQHARYCEICAELCRACAEECDRVGGNDSTMRQCADQCRACAKSCESMTAAR
jgi:hypothetical protein